MGCRMGGGIGKTEVGKRSVRKISGGVRGKTGMSGQGETRADAPANLIGGSTTFYLTK